MADLQIVDKSLRSVFVGNIPYEASEDKLKEIFNQVGHVSSFKLVFDRETGRPKGYGFCEYKDQETALSAMRNLNGFEIGGRTLRVDNACTEKSRLELQDILAAPTSQPQYGKEVDPEKAPEVISKAVASLPPDQMLELMKQIKFCVKNNPHEARTMLLQNPQLAYALLQAQVVMRIVDPTAATSMLHATSMEPPVLLPPNEGMKPMEDVDTLRPMDRNPYPSEVRDMLSRTSNRPPGLYSNENGMQFMENTNIHPTFLMDRTPDQTGAQNFLNRGASNEAGFNSSVGLQNQPFLNYGTNPSRSQYRTIQGTGPSSSFNVGPSFSEPRDEFNVGMVNQPGMVGGAGMRDSDIRYMPVHRGMPDGMPNFAAMTGRNPDAMAAPASHFGRDMDMDNEMRYSRRDSRMQSSEPVPRSSANHARDSGTSSRMTYDEEKAALIKQVLELTDDQISLLPPDQQESLIQLKERFENERLA